MATETASMRDSGELGQKSMILDTTMTETPVAGLTASPLPKTASTSEETSEDQADSESDYSDDEFESPSNSRPTSTEAKIEQPLMEDKAEEQIESTDGEQQHDTEIRSRPASVQTEEASVGGAVDVQSVHHDTLSVPDEVEVDGVSGLPQTEHLVEVPFEPVQEPDVPNPEEGEAAADEVSDERPELALDTSPTNQDMTKTSSARETPTISVSSEPDSPDGSNYSGSPARSPAQSPQTPTIPISPMTPNEAHMSIDSLQSIALSESSLDYDHLSKDQVEDVQATPRVRSVRHLRKPSSLEILQNTWGPPVRQETFFDYSKDEPLETPIIGPEDERQDFFEDTTSAWQSESSSSLHTTRRDSSSSGSDIELDWDALDLTEEQEKEDKDLGEGTEDASTAFLLARLEQENAKFSADPKSSVSPAVPKNLARIRSQSRPPSMALLKKLVSKDSPSIRYSLTADVQQQLPIEDPPPMTELEFWAALVQDYPSTASRLPTLTTTKIRAGIPPPLRGVVWASMSGARDKSLEDSFESLKDEKSPYEGIINKDVGRSFPGVELFRDAEGEGQKMLGRVLKCFSLHDKDIGYCQGLGFLVGPLLMNMGEQEAFCVLVR